MRSELQRASVEHQVRFSNLHEKRADILAQINSALTDAAWAAEQAANPMGWADDPPKEEQAVTAINAVASAFRLFDHNRLYLPPALGCHTGFEKPPRQQQPGRPTVIDLASVPIYDPDRVVARALSQERAARRCR